MSAPIVDTEDLLEAARITGPAMITNPGLAAVLGGTGPEHEQTAVRFFEIIFQHVPADLHGYRRDGALVGVARRMRWPGCSLSEEEGARVVPMLHDLLGDRLARLGERSRVWAQYDPKRPHWHLGPLAVATPHQGQGIGSELIEWFVAGADADGLPAYLETDKVENKRLYERFGFVVQAEADAIGVPHWFMLRETR